MISISKEMWSVIAMGVVSGLCSFFAVLSFLHSSTLLILSMPGIFFGVSVIKLASIRHSSILRKVGWVLAGWISFQCAFWFFLIMNPFFGFGVFHVIIFIGSTGLVGGVMLLIACRVFLGSITKKETLLSLTLAFLIPAVFLVIIGIEKSGWLYFPKTQYFFFTMTTWQTAALLLIDALVRRHALPEVTRTPVASADTISHDHQH